VMRTAISPRFATKTFLKVRFESSTARAEALLLASGPT